MIAPVGCASRFEGANTEENLADLGAHPAALVCCLGLIACVDPVSNAQAEPGEPPPATTQATAERTSESPTAPKKVLVVVPLGAPDAALAQFVADSFERRFNFEVRVADPMPLPEEAYYAPRKRWRAEKILDYLDEQDFQDAWRVAAITEQPISTTKGEIKDWGIAGLGSIAGKSSVFTSYLFRGFKRRDPAKYRRYMENLVLHEVGHTLGLYHCPLDRCIMADAKGNAVRAAEKSINEFCPMCFRGIRRHLRADEVQGEWSSEEMAAHARRMLGP